MKWDIANDPTVWVTQERKVVSITGMSNRHLGATLRKFAPHLDRCDSLTLNRLENMAEEIETRRSEGRWSDMDDLYMESADKFKAIQRIKYPTVDPRQLSFLDELQEI